MNLRAARLNRGLSLMDAGTLIGVHRRTLYRAEQGEMPQAALAKKIADFYGVQVTDIWPVDDDDETAAA